MTDTNINEHSDEGQTSIQDIVEVEQTLQRKNKFVSQNESEPNEEIDDVF